MPSPPPGSSRRLGEAAAAAHAAKSASAYDDLDIQTQTEAEAKAEAEEAEASAGPFARPRGRRLLFGGLNSGVGARAPAAFDNNACYCQMKDYNVPVKDMRHYV